MTHPGDRLSALIDGALDRQSAAEVSDHVAACPRCADELDEVRAARRLVRSLPAAEPPPGFLDSLLVVEPAVARPVTARPAALLVPAAVVLAVAVLLGGTVPPDPTAPGLAGAVSRHAATVQSLAVAGVGAADGGSRPLAPPVTVTPTTGRPVDEPGGRWVVQERLAGGYRLVGAFHQPDGIQLAYESGRYGLSVFQQVGRLDPADLPAGAVPVAVGGHAGWRWEGGAAQGRIVVFETGLLVVTAVGDEPGDAVLEAMRSLPEPSGPSLVDRLRRGAAELVEGLSPAG